MTDGPRTHAEAGGERNGADGRIPVLISIDVEPDEHVFDPDRPSRWDGFERLSRRVSTLRGELAAATGAEVRFCWSLRMDPQIAEGYGTPSWVAERHRAVFDDALAHGDSLGVHPHAWRWIGSEQRWLCDHGNASWVAHCIEVSAQSFRDSFGFPPRHHRFGGRFMSTEAMNLVRTLGMSFDLTLEPGEPSIPSGHLLGAEWTGATPDYAGVLRTPYRPDPGDFRRPAPDGGDGLWTIPLTSGRHVTHEGAMRKAVRRLAHPGRTMRRILDRSSPAGASSPEAARPPYRTLEMYDFWQRPQDLWTAAFDSIEEIDPPYLAFSVRSDVAIRRHERRIFEGIMRHLLTDPRAPRLVFTTPSDALERLGLAPAARP